MRLGDAIKKLQDLALIYGEDTPVFSSDVYEPEDIAPISTIYAVKNPCASLREPYDECVTYPTTPIVYIGGE